MDKVISLKSAVDLVKDGMTLGVSGFLTFGAPEDLLVALEEKFLKKNSPRDLTLYYGGTLGAGEERGNNHFAHKGFLKKLHGGHIALGKKLLPLIEENAFAAYMVPQGVNMQLMRALAGKKPGVITTVGLKTYADPRLEGCKANKAATEDIVELITVHGKEYLFYKTFNIDICFIKGTSSDLKGNISFEKEGLLTSAFELAAAVKNNGGIVVAQVDRVVENGTIHPKDVRVPEILVDYIVVGRPEYSVQSYAESYNASWSGEIRVPTNLAVPIPLNIKKICSRRCALELKKGMFGNLGIGIPQDIAAVADEEGITDEILLSVESGVIGGVPAGGMGMGASLNPSAIIKHPEMFDLYDGGRLDITFLGAAEIDEQGNVNVSKFAGRLIGPGGFINISQNTNKICFCGTFLAGKMEYEIKDGMLNIIKDANGIKFKKRVEQITFSGEYANETEQDISFITERAVFKLTQYGLMLTEIAPGVDIQKHILDKMDFAPIVSNSLKLMDERIFRDAKMGINI